MKSLKKQNNMLFKLVKITSTHQELKNIKKIKKASYYSPTIYGSSDSGDSESINSSILYLSNWEGETPLEGEINKLYNSVSTNIKSNQINDVINNELKFNSNNTLANNPVNDSSPIVTVILRGDENYKH